MSSIGYLVDVGILLNETNGEFNSYNMVYDKKHGFYDEDQYMKNDLDEAIEEVKTYIKNGIINTYGVITKQDFYLDDEVQGCYYGADAVVYSIYKKENDQVIENFIEKLHVN